MDLRISTKMLNFIKRTTIFVIVMWVTIANGSKCSNKLDCKSCTNTKNLGTNCRWCPVDQKCHNPGAIMTNPCKKNQNIKEVADCPDETIIRESDNIFCELELENNIDMFYEISLSEYEELNNKLQELGSKETIDLSDTAFEDKPNLMHDIVKKIAGYGEPGFTKLSEFAENHPITMKTILWGTDGLVVAGGALSGGPLGAVIAGGSLIAKREIASMTEDAVIDFFVAKGANREDAQIAYPTVMLLAGAKPKSKSKKIRAPPPINPTYNDLIKTLPGHAIGPDGKILKGKGYQVHHILPKYLGKQLGYTIKEMNNHPATLITQWAHKGKENQKALHKAIDNHLPNMKEGVKQTYSKEQIKKGLEKAYSEINRPDLFDAIKHLIE